MEQAGFRRDVRESAVAIIFKKMRDRLLPLGKSFEAPAIHEKNIEPVVVVVIVEGGAATRCFEKIFVFVLAAVNRFYIQPGFASDIQKTHADLFWRRRIRIRSAASGMDGVGSKKLACIPAETIAQALPRERAHEREDTFERPNQRGTAQRFKKCAA